MKAGTAVQLSKDQLNAVNSNDHAIVVVASAGSGKTEVAAQRVERLLSQDPNVAFRILAISYTVKAADELSQRLRQRLGQLHERVDTNTVHGFAHQLLREHGTRIGLPVEPEVLSRDVDRVELLARWLDARGQRAPDDPLAILRQIDLQRARLRSDAMTDAWSEALENVGALDYESMLAKATELLELPSARRHLVRLYGHILVDEAQNLTPAQYQLITGLAGRHDADGRVPIMLVGDDKQSIVSFAGADPTLIEQFERDFAATRFELKENYRSARAIVELGEAVAHRLAHPRSTSVVQYAAAGLVEVRELRNENSEGQSVARWATSLLEDGLPAEALAPGETPTVGPADLAVLGRSAAALRSVRQQLLDAGVPVAATIGPDEWLSTVEAKIVFEVVALRSAGSHQSTHWQLARLLDTGEADVATPEALAATLRSQTDPKLCELAAFAELDTPHALIELLRSKPTAESATEEWVAAWDADCDQINETWRAFVAVTDAAVQTWGNFRMFVARLQRGADMSDGVRLLTIHKAQGQEYRAVAVVGLNDGQLPDFRATTAEEQLSELRTFYVAITRPTRVLLLTRAQSRMTRYGSRSTERSPYLEFLGA